MRTMRDPESGFQYRLLTEASAPSRKFYYSQDSFVADDSAVVYLRYLGDKPELSIVDIGTGESSVLIAASAGQCSTFGMAWSGDRGYLQRGDELLEVDLATGRTGAVARLPDGAVSLGHFTVSASGLVANAMQLESKIYSLVVADPASGTSDVVLRTDVRLGHCQISPTDENLIFHVHETGGDALQRMWMFDRRDGRRRPYFVEQDGDWITHETWHPSGEYLSFIKWPHAIMKGWSDGQRFEVVAEGEFHHAAPDRSGKWFAADRTRTGEILLVPAVPREGAPRETVLVTGQRARTGADHCHPSFNRAGDSVVFSAPGGGVCQIGVVELDQVAAWNE